MKSMPRACRTCASAKWPMRHLAMTGMVTASTISTMRLGSAIRATPPSRRMSAGTRSRPMTATAPASSPPARAGPPGLGLLVGCPHGLVEELQELLEVEGLRQVGAGPRLQQSLDLAAGRVGAQHHHRDVGGGGVAAEARQDVGPRDVRQVEVQEDEVGMVLACQLQPEAARHRGNEPDAGPEGD